VNYRKKHIKPKIKRLKKTKPVFMRRWFWLLALALVLVGGFTYLVFFSPWLAVAEVAVSGNENVPAQSVLNIAWNQINHRALGISSQSMVLADTGRISGDLLADIPKIARVSVVKQWPHRISISLEERRRYAVFCQSQKGSAEYCFSIDQDGVIFEPLQEIPQDALVMRQTAGAPWADLGRQAVAQSDMAAVVAVRKNLQDRFQIPVMQMSVASTMVATTAEGWQVSFDLGSDINAQIAKLDALLENQITPEARKKLQYIYLQYRDRAYYK
jgi:cell division septal protein FtsQ